MSDAEQVLLNKIIYTSIFVPVILCGLLIWFLIYFQKKKHQTALLQKEDELKIQKLKLEKQQSLQNERTRIAAEMHDDLGGGLTTIKFLGQKMLRKIDNLEQKTQLNKIVNNSQELVSNMSEIIWAMNAGFDTLDNLVAYCRRYASEYLADNDLKLKHSSSITEEKIEFSGEKRRHVFLVFKELLHNIAKHAEAKEVAINWTIQNEQIILQITDDGIGMEKNWDELSTTGNGIRNMTDRIHQLGGNISWKSNRGTQTEIRIPIASLEKYLSA